MESKQTAILMDCIDQLAGVPIIPKASESNELAQSIIDTLGSYPRPTAQCLSVELGAYLYASTARNTIKLAQLGYLPFDNAFSLAGTSFEASLSLLID